ncbi:MAG TPA: T9SS type A sorting domain-containing protein [Bacteroidia bacterium]|nr:T9SS type A sorting domain-containing protein [Bacteroidia bacterium]
MRGKILSILFFVFSFSLCEGQSWMWGEQGKIKWTQDLGEGFGTATDSVHDIYFVGYFRDTVSFGAYSIATNQYYGDVYLVKYDSNGNVLWVTAPNTKATISSSDAWIVSTDAVGNAYVTGQIYDTVIFGSFKLFAHRYGVFLTKYDKNGNVIWARQSDGDGNGEGAGLSICTDNHKHEYITGVFSDTLYFGTDTLRTSSNDIFIVKYDSNGNVIWSKQAIIQSKNSSGIAYSVAYDNMNNIYVTGYFQDTITFGTTELISSNNDVFLAKYDSSGNVLWAKQCGTNRNSSAYGYAVASDMNGNAYVTGYFKDTINFGTHILMNDTKYANFFITKFDLNGNVIWAKAPIVLDTNGWEGYALSTDRLGHLYFTGGAASGYAYDEGIVFEGDTFSLKNGYDASILLKLDTSGNLLCGTILTSGGDDANSIVCDPTGKYVYMGGDLVTGISSYIFGQDTLTSNFGAGSEYPFVARWQPCDTNITTSIPPISNKPSISLFPNPSPGLFTLAFAGQQNVVSGRIEVYNVLGEKVTIATLKQVQSDNRIDLTNQPNGIYLYRVISEDGNVLGSGKIIVQK